VLKNPSLAHRIMVLKEKFKNVAAHYFSGLSAYVTIRVDCKQFNRGETFMVLPSSLSQRSYLVIASRVCVGFGRKNRTRKGIITYD
jgi:hypothetical protein